MPKPKPRTNNHSGDKKKKPSEQLYGKIARPCPADVSKLMEVSSQDKVNMELDMDTRRQFELELCWCIQQLESALTSSKSSDRQIHESWKALSILKNNNESMIRKRQVMRTYCGDYRAKMQKQERKLIQRTRKMKMAEKPVPKATFLRKSLFQTSGDNSFKFNFNSPTEEKISDDKKKNKIVDNVIIISGDSEPNKNITQPHVSETGRDRDSSDNTKETINKSEAIVIPNKIKFEYTKTEFKFNFNVIDTEDSKETKMSDKLSSKG